MNLQEWKRVLTRIKDDIRSFARCPIGALVSEKIGYPVHAGDWDSDVQSLMDSRVERRECSVGQLGGRVIGMAAHKSWVEVLGVIEDVERHLNELPAKDPTDEAVELFNSIQVLVLDERASAKRGDSYDLDNIEDCVAKLRQLKLEGA